MGRFNFNVPAIGNKFIDYRDPILGNSYTWHWERPMNQVKYLIIHHTAGPDTQTPDIIAEYHVRTKSWGGVGYHFIIDKNGTVYYVGDLTTARAHTYNYNHLGIGICLMGSFMGRQPPDEQINSTHELCSQLLFRTPELPGTDGWEDVVPHKQFRATACPGDTWDLWQQKVITGTAREDRSEKATEIRKLYQAVLGREADQSGLEYYLSGSMTIAQIRKAMVESSEHRQIINKASNFKRAQTLATEARNYISSAYGKVDEIVKISG